MASHIIHEKKEEVYFVTFKCYNWLNLFSEANAYHLIYKWFDYLKTNNVDIIAYVIMPNHFHGLVYLNDSCTKNLNQLIGNGKRFMAYETVEQLFSKKNFSLIKHLKKGVSKAEKLKNKKHQVFRSSFDAKECISEKEIEVKLNYIHNNPSNGKWLLVNDFVEYPHSSAAFYELNQPNRHLTHYKQLNMK